VPAASQQEAAAHVSFVPGLDDERVQRGRAATATIFVIHRLCPVTTLIGVVDAADL
jgi:hypothetical protein